MTVIKEFLKLGFKLKQFTSIIIYVKDEMSICFSEIDRTYDIHGIKFISLELHKLIDRQIKELGWYDTKNEYREAYYD